jgi:hypothetical protein
MAVLVKDVNPEDLESAVLAEKLPKLVDRVIKALDLIMQQQFTVAQQVRDLCWVALVLLLLA